MDDKKTFNFKRTKRANGYSNILFERLRSQRDNKQCDMVLKVEDQTFYVHKCILNASCDYFDAMSRSGMQETRQDAIKLEDITIDAFKTISDFIYSGELRLNFDDIEEVLRVISLLQVNHALALCEEYLCDILNEDNYIYILKLSDLFSINNLKDFVLKFILQNFSIIVNNESFKMLTYEQFELCLQSNRLIFYPEIRVFNVLIDWLKTNLNARTKYLPSLIKHIRFHIMEPREFIDIVSKSDLIKQHYDACKMYLIEAYEYFALPNRQYSNSSIRSQIRNEPSIVCVNENIYILNKRQDSWQYLCHSIATSKTLSQKFIVVNNFLYACGGYSELNRETTNECNRFNPITGVWQKISPMNEKRQFFTLSSFNEQIIAVGGVFGEHGNFYATFPVKAPIEIYCIEKDAWKTYQNKNLPILKWPGACLFENNRIFIAGGKMTESESNNILCQKSYLIDLKSNSDAIEICEPPLNTRFNPGLFYLNSETIILFAGEDDRFRMAPCVELFNLNTKQWSEIATIPISLGYQSISSISLINNTRKIFYLSEEHGPSSESYILKASYFDLNNYKFEKCVRLPQPNALASKWFTLVFPQEYLEKCQNNVNSLETHIYSTGQETLSSQNAENSIQDIVSFFASSSETNSSDTD